MLENTRRHVAPHAGYPWSVDSRFPLIRALGVRGRTRDGREKGRKSAPRSPVNRQRFRSLGNRAVRPAEWVFSGDWTNGKTGTIDSIERFHYRALRFIPEESIIAI